MSDNLSADQRKQLAIDALRDILSDINPAIEDRQQTFPILALLRWRNNLNRAIAVLYGEPQPSSADIGVSDEVIEAGVEELYGADMALARYEDLADAIRRAFERMLEVQRHAKPREPQP